jgi:Putative Actinobacterial Holin-X, holin superfamily III
MARPRKSTDVAEAAKRDVAAVLDSLEDEVDRLRHEAAERAQAAGKGAALIGTAGTLGLVSVGALGSLPILALRRVLPAWQIALLVAGGSAAGAVALARAGAARLAAIGPESLERQLKETVENVVDAAR